MEAFWFYPWLLWLRVWPAFADSSTALSLPVIIIVLGVSLLLTKIFLSQKWSLGTSRWLLLGCGLVAILLALRIEYGGGYAFFDWRWLAYAGSVLGAVWERLYPMTLAVVVLGYLWWRGIMLGSATAYLNNIYRSFTIGMASLALLIIFWKLTSYSGIFEGPSGDVGFYVLGFFFFGLLAISILNLSLMRQQMPREDASLTSAWRWLPMILGAIGSVILVSVGIASLFSFQLVVSTGTWLGTVADGIWKILGYILIPLNYLVESFFYLLRLITAWMYNEGGMAGSGNVSFEEQTETIAINLSPVVIAVLKWVVLAAVIVVIVYFLAKTVYKRRADSEHQGVEEISESLFSWNGLKDDMQLFLTSLRHRFDRKKPPASRWSGINTEGDDSAIMNIREIYHNFLMEAAEYGVARWRQETPKEYARRLSGYFQDDMEPINEITGLYEYVRYGDREADKSQIENANVLWRWLRKRLRRSD